MRNYSTVMSVVHALKQSDPARRVAAMLAVLIEGDGEGPIEAIASQTDIGELVNLGRSKVNASLRALEELGLVRRGYGSIEVIDPKALRAFVHETGTRKPAKQARAGRLSFGPDGRAGQLGDLLSRPLMNRAPGGGRRL
jgi:hypothetical protein